MSSKECSVCVWEKATGKQVDTSKSKVAWAEQIGVSEASVRRHLKHPQKPLVAGESREESSTGERTYTFMHERAITRGDAEAWLEESGLDPDDFIITISTNAYGSAENPMWSNKMKAIPKIRKGELYEPKWPVIHPASPEQVIIRNDNSGVSARPEGWKVAVLMSDTQFGYREGDNFLEEFHDNAAIDVALQIVDRLQPERVVVMGDIIDLPSQSKYAQEAGFARTTQRALDRTFGFAYALREAAPAADIDFIEGNHDKRMQNFIEANALAAFGLKRAQMPESWPVMSIPNLLRLDELNITYHDAYPTAHVWINSKLRCEHGTKANSNGSTMHKYLSDTPHISRAAGHSHRLEVMTRTTYDREGKIVTTGINTGCLCRVDGAVPSVHGGIHADGTSATVYEDWTQGIAVVYYTDNDFRVDLVHIIDGMAIFQGEIYYGE